MLGNRYNIHMITFSLPIDFRLGLSVKIDGELCCEYYGAIGDTDEKWFGGWCDYASKSEDEWMKSILPTYKIEAQHSVLNIPLGEILKHDKSMVLFTEYIPEYKCEIICELYFENVY